MARERRPVEPAGPDCCRGPVELTIVMRLHGYDGPSLAPTPWREVFERACGHDRRAWALDVIAAGGFEVETVRRAFEAVADLLPADVRESLAAYVAADHDDDDRVVRRLPLRPG